VGLVLLAPVLLVIALVVKLHDRGPVFYRATRVGKDGVGFKLYKFRSMTIGADKTGPAITAHNDARVTSIGRFLRNTKLDELPQLFNVLFGDMSVVGPRPEDPCYVDLYTAQQREVLRVRPGITSAASLKFRHEEDLLKGEDWETMYRTHIMPEKIAIDLDHIRNPNVFRDAGLIVSTIASLFVPTRPAFRNRYLLISDVLTIVLTVYLAFSLRLETLAIFPAYLQGFVALAGAGVIVMPALMFRSGAYGRYWPFAAPGEFLQLGAVAAIAAGLASMVAMAVLWLSGAPVIATELPRSVPLLFTILAPMLVSAPRVAARALYGQRVGDLLNVFQSKGHDESSMDPTSVIIVGAGGVGARLAREMRLNAHWRMLPVGFLDDDASKHGLKIQGVPVLGACNRLPEFTAAFKVKQVVIAMSMAPGKTVREVVQLCNDVKVPVKVMPGINEVLDGKVNVSKLRDVEIEDLLRRAPVRTDVAAVGALIHGKRVLVTGGGGSIGSELCRQIIALGPSELVLVGHGENSIFEVQNELAPIAADRGSRLLGVIADIRFEDRVGALIKRHQPDVIFHAAAHKHVPLMELNPAEAVTNNVIGTRNLLNAAHENRVEAFVMISTDKAVNPSNVMGASKRTAELLMRQAASRPGNTTRFCAVRFGNVLGSRGSVVLTFKKQIAQGGPVTITHPDMKRYFMTIPEAVQLVMQASVLSKNGEIFVLDMGEPIKISDLAQDLIRLSGYEVGSDIELRYSGLRPGEKLFEELFLGDEEYVRTQHEKIFVAANASQLFPEQLSQMIARLEDAARRNNQEDIIRQLKQIVPEYSPGVVQPRVMTPQPASGDSASAAFGAKGLAAAS
jgi:FlaA1/EpsC-like NDP-sugar epimerase/lipopolysaccharide/colanic/teichoic acid biosynthesis glycosyltransferase